MLVDGEYPVQEVAAILGVHRTTVWRWFQHKEMRRYYERYADKQVNAELRKARRAAQKEAERLGKLLDSNNPTEAYGAAIKIIDSMGDWLRS